MKTIKDMRAEVIRTLEEGTPDGPDGYDVDKIVDELYDAAGYSWDVDIVAPSAFWGIVYTNAKPEATQHETVGPTAENLVTLLIKFYAQRRNGRHSVPGSEILIQAWQLAHGGSEEEADVAVGELLTEIYADAG